MRCQYDRPSSHTYGALRWAFQGEYLFPYIDIFIYFYFYLPARRVRVD